MQVLLIVFGQYRTLKGLVEILELINTPSHMNILFNVVKLVHGRSLTHILLVLRQPELFYRFLAKTLVETSVGNGPHNWFD